MPLPDPTSLPDPATVRLRLTGTVQGVNLRYTVYRAARRIGILGLVRNEPDGSVTLVVAGGLAALQEFVAWCYTEPVFAEARVETLAVYAGVSECRDFVIAEP